MNTLYESLTFQTLDCFERLHLIEFDEKWVNDQWNNGFSFFDDYPYSIEIVFPEGIRETVSRIINVCEKWITFQQNIPNNADVSHSVGDALNSSLNTSVNEILLWTTLRDNGVEVKYILSLIYLFCSRCVKTSASLYDKEIGLSFSKLYLILLLIPGSTAYSVFQQNLYQAAIDCLKIPKEKLVSKKRPPPSAYRNDVVSQRKRVRREFSEEEEVPNDSEELPESSDSNSNDNAGTDFSSKECEEIMFGFAEVMKSLMKFLTVFSLKNEEILYDQTVQKLAECVACESHSANLNFDYDVNHINSRKYGSAYIVTLLAYQSLSVISESLHGSEEINFVLIFKYLMPHILCSKAKGQSVQTIPHKFLVVRDNAVSFVCYNLKKNAKACLSASYILVQQLCTRVMDKTDFRAKVSQAVVTILKHFPIVQFAKMCKWLQILCSHNKVQNRVFGLEVFSLLINESKPQNTEDLPSSLHIYVTNLPIAKAMLECCNDKASSVRTKALSLLAMHIEKILSTLKREIRNITLRPSTAEDDARSSDNNEDDNNHSGNEDNGNHQSGDVSHDANNNEEEEEEEEDDEFLVNQSCSEDYQVEYRIMLDKIIHMLHRRAGDFKVYARKAALQAVENLMSFDETCTTEKNLQLFLDAAGDSNIMVRKQAILSISSLLEAYNDSSEIQRYWLRCVLPLVLDGEKTVQSKCLEVLEAEFLHNINSSGEKRRRSWDLLNKIACGEYQTFQRYLSKAFTLWKGEGKLRPNIYTFLERQIGTENNPAVWMLLSILVANIELKKTEFITNYWDYIGSSSVPTSTILCFLSVVRNTSKHIPVEVLETIKGTIERAVKRFTCTTELIASYIETLFKIYTVVASSESNAEKLIAKFATETMKASEQYLSSVLLQQSSSNLLNEDAFKKHLFTLGELAQLCPSCVPNKVNLIVQSLIASFTSCSATETKTGRSSTSGRNGRSSNFSVLTNFNFSPEIQALTFITLGKMCLQNEDLAKKCVPALARELQTSEHYAIRNNVVIVMVDLCMRYTLLVDLYMPSVSSCLKDDNSLVRYQALVLITKLLQQDYIKWKGTLFYRMLSTVIDENKEIREFAEYAFCCLIIKRQETIFVQNFVESIFYFNCYTGSGTYCKIVQTSSDMERFALKGKNNSGKRMQLYKFMIKNTHAPLRIRLTSKLCREILNSVAENVLSLDEGGEAVVKDCLAVLSCEEIKLPNIQTNAAEEGEEQEAAENILQKISQTHKVILVQQIVPIVISLKKTLENLKSPLLNDLMVFLREILKDYKNELKDIFAADKQLAKEIEFDIRRYEKLQEQMQAEEQQNEQDPEEGAAAVNTPAPTDVRASRRAELLKSSEKALRVTHQLTSNSIQTMSENIQSPRKRHLATATADDDNEDEAMQTSLELEERDEQDMEGDKEEGVPSSSGTNMPKKTLFVSLERLSICELGERRKERNMEESSAHKYLPLTPTIKLNGAQQKKKEMLRRTITDALTMGHGSTDPCHSSTVDSFSAQPHVLLRKMKKLDATRKYLMSASTPISTTTDSNFPVNQNISDIPLCDDSELAQLQNAKSKDSESTESSKTVVTRRKRK